ncbi:Golgi-associated plant pathogenesis-related protein 1-like [Schistocerca gregaria]|uniref:Golgi-associated plant pathogenesis-related protein 1-like n=1 Tax=Schistocerca gregaria TaxID=7010 RepID=UPI00211DD7C2|nr:Golgi-associated plant pathogenesis-related protein 1-like [Schistocerca gregaria]
MCHDDAALIVGYYGVGRVATADTPPPLDNRPQLLLQRILSNRPLSIVNDENNGQLETDWRHSEFINECLLWHNVYRQRHSARPLALCPQLCSYAQAWANHLAHVNTFYYRTDRDIGQNLFCRPTTTLQADVTGQEVVTYWYSAVRQYNYLKEPDILHANVNAGHFTQLVWASTTHVGLGKARSRSGKVLVVAHYRPAGNVSGLFQQNVFPPLALPQPQAPPPPPPPQTPAEARRRTRSRRRDDSDSESGSASESSASANAS